MKVAIYARVSSEKQERQETIQSQLAALRDYAKKNELTVIDEYVDNGYSGELKNRPELDRLRNDARSGHFAAVLVHSHDRLSRDATNFWVLMGELSKCSVRVVFLSRPGAIQTKEDFLSEWVLSGIAEYEKTSILDRTRRGKLHKASNNTLVTSQAPYGYLYVPIDKASNTPGHYVKVEEEAKVVNLMFRLLVKKGMSIRGIVRELAKKGIRTKSGKNWSRSSVARILKDETYAGTTYYNKHERVAPRTRRSGNEYSRSKNTSIRLRPKDEWKAITLPDDLRIIDRDTFERAQRQLEVNSRLSPRNTHHKYLLRGLLRCGTCDTPYYGTPCHGTLYYRCGNRHKTFPEPKECNAGSVRAETVESTVWSELKQAIENPDLVAKHYEQLQKRSRDRKPGILDEIKSIDKELATADREESRLLDAYTAEAISREQLKARMVKVDEKKRALEDRRRECLHHLEERRAKEFEPESVQQVCEKIAERIEAIRNDFEARRYLLMLLVTRIIIEGRKIRIKVAFPLSYPRPRGTACRIASQSSGCCGHRGPGHPTPPVSSSSDGRPQQYRRFLASTNHVTSK
ncbi:recombinase family protein [Candidatus Eisenbacteria bacterium]|uniref:Recombinase family protein n=1 Tax=Eiseniibacteriota bacterium TaxID=2212470 RepID=A0ABV6YMZ4_UNCEI